MQVTRQDIIDCLRRATEPLASVNAMWLGGSDAFGRADELSDVDVQLNVEPGTVEEAFRACEQALETLSPITLRIVEPEPAWHGHSQRFYRLRDASPFHHVDLFVLTRGKPPAFDEIELHGHPVVLFDKAGVVTTSEVDRAALQAKLEARLPFLVERVEMFHCYVDKELRRGNLLAALHFLRGLVLMPLVEVLRMRHTPARHDWGVRYAHTDLPPAVRTELEPLFLVADADAMRAAYERGLAWFRREVEERTAMSPAGNPRPPPRS